MLDTNVKDNKCFEDTVLSKPSTHFGLLSTEAIMTKLKRERDIAKCDVERLQMEVLALRKRLETATDVQMEEKCRYEKCIAKEEEKIKKLQLECEDLHKYQGELHYKVQGQEESISKLMTCLDAVKEELEREQCLNKHLKKKVDQKTKDLNNLELECQEKQSEVEHLGKCNSQHRQKYMYAKPYQDSFTSCIPPIDEERVTPVTMRGLAPNVTSHQKAAKAEEISRKKGPKLTVSLEQTRRSCMKLPQQKQPKSRMVYETEKGPSASTQTKQSRNCAHSKAKPNIRSMDKHSPRHSCKRHERSHCSPERSSVSNSVRGRYETMSPQGRSSSPASKIHVHANIPPGSLVNVELEDDDGSGVGEYYSNNSSCA